MELTLRQAFKKGLEAQRAGKVQEADRYYTAVLKAQPKNPEANHNLGALAVGIGKVEEALPYLRKALEFNPEKAQFWLSYIDALIKLDLLDDAKVAMAQAESKGFVGQKIDDLKTRLKRSNRRYSLKHTEKKSQPKILDTLKLDQAIKLAKNKAKSGSYKEAENIYKEILTKFPKNKKAIVGIRDLSNKVVDNTSPPQNPHRVQMQWLINLHSQGQFNKALSKASQLLLEFPGSSELYNFIGSTNKSLGKLEEALVSYTKALSIKPNYAQAYYNMGNALAEKGEMEKARTAYKKAIEYKHDYAKAMWNLSGTAENISEAKSWIQKCLSFDPDYEEAKLTFCALEYYQGDKTSFNLMMESHLRNHPYMRSFSWVFGLPSLPELFFHRWALFDRMAELSKKDRPFYEFGVWRGESFRYLIKTFKTGFGFDTFEGLPEDWDDFKAGSYSSDGNIPKIRGGDFIVGKFDDTLPKFFSEAKPMASIINFDADLYSSTICALNWASSVIDQHTILIFDEFLINPNWEDDECKALEEFCLQNYYKYEVLAVSFFSKQVAVRLISI